MTAEEQKNIRDFVQAMAISAITRPSQRDKQVAPGPSDLAAKCDVCVAKKIASTLGVGEANRSGFSLKAWFGTSAHEKLERELKYAYQHAEQEIEVEVCDIPGIGLVIGHIDVYLPRKRTLVDWKTSDKAKIEKYKKSAGPGAYTQGLTAQERRELEDLKIKDRAGLVDAKSIEMARLAALMERTKQHSGGVPEEYMGQTMLYLYGLRAMGREAEYAVLVFIPRDSNNISDIWVASCRYRPDVAEALIKRAAHLAQIARTGRFSELKPHPECWTCVIQHKVRR